MCLNFIPKLSIRNKDEYSIDVKIKTYSTLKQPDKHYYDLIGRGNIFKILLKEDIKQINIFNHNLLKL